ncbi:MAG: hypothetical protein FDX18_11545 [Chlorobium sp.]|nr:MAG: hypothetical protein FDX18_11545 [Chlorobium sp.]
MQITFPGQTTQSQALIFEEIVRFGILLGYHNLLFIQPLPMQFTRKIRKMKSNKDKEKTHSMSHPGTPGNKNFSSHAND